MSSHSSKAWERETPSIHEERSKKSLQIDDIILEYQKNLGPELDVSRIACSTSLHGRLYRFGQLRFTATAAVAEER